MGWVYRMRPMGGVRGVFGGRVSIFSVFQFSCIVWYCGKLGMLIFEHGDKAGTDLRFSIFGMGRWMLGV